ncbi:MULTISPECIES: mannose-1-phosphate guanylyltransferase/mannose-6-phosphate isomerase [Serratia]|jgi:mannose-1-phosphate guanylyltransferase|uniref:mannose-1-phosphate guanylyltransferase n=1 Tax=Serratia liquefaciens TaxID=614 RepID=A0A515CXX1_SERLI|nr:mannose-1-phosphate guanylyltransferase/mannose-6-phosphate isomerase [Serratia liquefaciens]MBI6164733.1 mannose-1-phosphate guanylyltransferase/mannose-6-phosphate isomerase [Serratia liquefaciens]MBV0841068.1 mannose-1-phosphate guanylyltransferase/mannose-6-phosphate isomerase [Serratia liquefaciens]QDL33014.1 mannose-1-phosphate guanylyltransferase/mannose-6-phosphate isomerase [Serratia liquefaciens]QQU53884.1 mannose-1-phosphate guanylyltransferase/mannose-6-phosphate isomerase [Serra
MLLPVIMAGGTGSRLWPMSRELHPKQFLRLHSLHSMLQETLKRLDGVEVSEPVVICNEDHRFMVAEQLRQIDMLSHNIILEPIGRNTAPAIALAALNAIAQGHDPIMLVLAADHIIKDVATFHHAIEAAIPYAAGQSLVTFGIVPSGPETGYGYIQRGESTGENAEASSVKRFVEKPDLATAQSYVDSGEYFWNSGMFMFRAKRYLEELERFRPDILDACRLSLADTECDKNFINVNYDAFSSCPDESVDYAVMEKTHDAVMIPLDAGWSDVGSWSALWEVSQKDEAGNALTGDTFLHNTRDCYINTDEKLVAAVGVDNLVIVNTKDAVLVVDKSKVQDVKKVVEHLKKHKRSEYRRHREVYRPWGICDLLVDEKRFNVNRITVNPGEAFSLQMHHHRTEHWVVLAGTARVTTGDKTFLLTENQSTFIPIGVIHRLENPGNIPLELIEVQAGSYLGDDDIIRIKDHYGRC